MRCAITTSHLRPTTYPGGLPHCFSGHGAWRDDSEGPLEVVSDPIGNERVHFEAPKAERVAGKMGLFLDWFEGAAAIDPVLKAGLAHLWFVTIHPFDDGNGRITRAIADMALGFIAKNRRLGA